MNSSKLPAKQKDQQANIQAAARDQFTSPPQPHFTTPLTPIQVNSPVCHQPYQQPLY